MRAEDKLLKLYWLIIEVMWTRFVLLEHSCDPLALKLIDPMGTHIFLYQIIYSKFLAHAIRIAIKKYSLPISHHLRRIETYLRSEQEAYYVRFFCPIFLLLRCIVKPLFQDILEDFLTLNCFSKIFKQNTFDSLLLQ